MRKIVGPGKTVDVCKPMVLEHNKLIVPYVRNFCFDKSYIIMEVRRYDENEIFSQIDIRSSETLQLIQSIPLQPTNCVTYRNCYDYSNGLLITKRKEENGSYYLK